MTEADWQTCADPDQMLAYLDGKVNERKLRLFACAICRRIWHLVTVTACRRAVEMAELFADGLVSPQECITIAEAANRARPLFHDGNAQAAWVALPADVGEVAAFVASTAAQAITKVATDPLRRAAAASVYTGASQDTRNAAWADYEAAEQVAFLSRPTGTRRPLARDHRQSVPARYG